MHYLQTKSIVFLITEYSSDEFSGANLHSAQTFATVYSMDYWSLQAAHWFQKGPKIHLALDSVWDNEGWALEAKICQGSVNIVHCAKYIWKQLNFQHETLQGPISPPMSTRGQSSEGLEAINEAEVWRTYVPAYLSHYRALERGVLQKEWENMPLSSLRGRKMRRTCHFHPLAVHCPDSRFWPCLSPVACTSHEAHRDLVQCIIPIENRKIATSEAKKCKYSSTSTSNMLQHLFFSHDESNLLFLYLQPKVSVI